MSDSPKEDPDQRNNTSMEDSTAMRIEFLRARLLSERSVSRTTRQRADELARRVQDLEEQLKIVSLQRKRAEKATEDVLAILESRGASDVSEAYDSSSDEEATPRGSEVGHSSFKEEETLGNGKLSGRSLSWKSGKDSPSSLEKKNVNSSRRRHSSFVSNASSSPKHVGKSCRQIRRRETRSAAEEQQIDASRLPLQGDEEAESSGVPTRSDFGPETLKEGSGNRQYLPEDQVLENLENDIVNNGHYISGHGEDKDMKRALEHQAQLIGRYEAEEKAQRDWEEKYRENNSHTPDSCDLGNHSDVTEERDDSRGPVPPFHTESFPSHNEELNLREAGVSLNNESVIPNGFQPPPQFDPGFIQDQKFSSKITYKPPALEFASSMAKSSHDQEAEVSSRNGSSLHKEASGSSNEVALMPHEPSKDLGSVLEALQQAKLSLKQNLNRSSQVVESGSLRKPFDQTGDRFELPVGSAGLFQLPTDTQYEATTRGNYFGSGSQLSLTNYHYVPAADNRFNSSPYVESRSSTSSGDRVFTPNAYPYMDLGSGLPTRFPIFRTTLESGPTTISGYNSPDPHLRAGIPSSSNYAYPGYPSYSDVMPRVQSADGLSRSLTSSEVGLPPTTRFPFYGDHTRPNMYG